MLLWDVELLNCLSPISDTFYMNLSYPNALSPVLTRMDKFPDNIYVDYYPLTVSFGKLNSNKRKGSVSWFCISLFPYPPSFSQFDPLSISSLNIFMGLGWSLKIFFGIPCPMHSNKSIPSYSGRETEAQMKYRGVLNNLFPHKLRQFVLTDLRLVRESHTVYSGCMYVACLPIIRTLASS